MAGVADEARMYVFLLYIAVFMRLGFTRRRKRFQQRLRFLAIRSGRRRREPYFFFILSGRYVADEKLRGFWKTKATILVLALAVLGKVLFEEKRLC
jgi:hypothetical protein